MKKIYGNLFENATGKAIGSWVEKKLMPQVFCDVMAGTNAHHDGMTKLGKKKVRLEYKCFRAVYSSDAAESTISIMNSLSSRACYSCDDRHDVGVDQNGELRELKIQAKFQQVKPKDCDYLLGVAIFLDKMRVYLVPSSDIEPEVHSNTDRIRLHAQHRNKGEGQIYVKDLTGHMILEIDTPLEKIESRKLEDYL